MPHFLYRGTVAAARRQARAARLRKTYIAVYFCEQPPDPESRVALSDEKDMLGMNRLRLHWRIDPSVTVSLMRMQELLRPSRSNGRELAAWNPERAIRVIPMPHITWGATRMSASPLDGVVDVNCRAHGVENLYIAGSSVFPCAGHANPTLTIVALSLRLARHLRGLPV